MCGAGTDPCAVAMEVGFNPGVFGSEKLPHRTNRDHLAVGKSRDSITDGMKAVEVVGDQSLCPEIAVPGGRIGK